MGKAAILGRETAIQEVYWTEDGWLRLVDGGNGPLAETEIVTAEPVAQRKNTNFRDDFTGVLDKEWNSLRILADESWCDLTSREGYVRVISGDSIQSLFEHHILAIRQKDFQFHASTKIDYTPKTYNQMAGLLLYLNDSNYLYAYLTYDEEVGRVLRLMKCVDGEFTLSRNIIPTEEGEIELKIEVNGPVGSFYYRMGDKSYWKELGETQDLLFLAGGFTGNFVGIAVHDMDRKAGSYADFEFFEYRGLDSL
jgi:xylan 1,4-beta-xylosidase